MIVPHTLKWLEQFAAGKRWLLSLPDTIDHVCAEWSLSPCGSPMEGGNVSYILPVTDGSSKNPTHILKLQWPHPECEHEAAALQLWNGNGAIRLLRHNPQHHALLLELCKPGQTLAGSGRDPIPVYTDLLPKLWNKTTHPFQTQTQESAIWLALLLEQKQRTPNDDLIDPVIEIATGLLSETRDEVLIHQDMHGLNILSAEREAWLAIDPKPLVGERELAVAPIIRSSELGHSQKDVLRRLNELTENLNLDRQRVLAWTVFQTLAWSLSATDPTKHRQVVGWLLQDAHL